MPPCGNYIPHCGVESVIMAMTIGSTRQAISNVNVTPLIDVLLVLLIIFMVIAPADTVGLHAAIP